MEGLDPSRVVILAILFGFVKGATVPVKSMPSTCKVCDLQCSSGYALDTEFCRCLQAPPMTESHVIPSHCSKLDCPIRNLSCDVFRKDAQGCPTCNCLCQNDTVQCPKDCRTDQQEVKVVRTQNGCLKCECTGASKEAMKCPHSLVCRGDCTADPFKALTDLACNFGCSGGLHSDSHGCPVCRCPSHNTTQEECDDICKFCKGDSILDEKGCLVCECSSFFFYSRLVQWHR